MFADCNLKETILVPQHRIWPSSTPLLAHMYRLCKVDGEALAQGANQSVENVSMLQAEACM